MPSFVSLLGNDIKGTLFSIHLPNANDKVQTLTQDIS